MPTPWWSTFLAIDAQTLAPARRLALVQKFGTVVTNIDRAACTRRGVPVATLRRRVNVAVAEQAFALVIALGKRVPSSAAWSRRRRSRRRDSP